MAPAVRTILMTAPDAETADELGGALVEARLAACANVVPGVRSIYWWEGEVERSEEVLVILKTREERVAELLERAAELHPYDVPELLVLAVSEGHDPYLQWVERETRSGPDAA